MTTISIKLVYPKEANLEELAKLEEDFAQKMESLGVEVEFTKVGILPRPRRPIKE